MKKLLALILIAVMFILNSCSSNTVMVWNWKDVIGLSFLGLIVAIGIIAFVYEYIKQLFKK